MNKKKTLTMPFIGDFTYTIGRTILGIVLGLLVGAILILLSGVNPITAYGHLWEGAFGSMFNFSNVLVRSSPLLLGGIGVALGINAGVWNTGIEGFMYLGAIGASLAAVPELNLPPALHLLLCFVIGMIAAGIWGFIPGYLRAYAGVNEVTCTIMMNYIAIYLAKWFATSSWIADKEAFYPMSLKFQKSAQMAYLIKGTSLHIGPFIGMVICLFFAFVLRYTTFGFRTRMLGKNPVAAQYAGVNSKKQIVFIMILGAVIGGLSGAIEVCGLKRRLYMDFVAGIGYESVAVALVAGGNPIGVILSALFFSMLKAGGARMAIKTGISSSMNSIIIAICVLFVIGVGVADSRRIKVYNEKDDSPEPDTLPGAEKKEEV